MRRWLLPGFGMVSLLVLLGSVVALRMTRPADHINPQSFAALRPGMTWAEVEALLGDPRDYHYPGGHGTKELESHGVMTFSPYSEWVGEKYAILVHFPRVVGHGPLRPDTPITGYALCEVTEFQPMPIWDQLRRWLRV